MTELSFNHFVSPLKCTLVLLSLWLSSAHMNAQTNEDAAKPPKKKLTQKLWGKPDSNAIEKNVVIKEGFVTQNEVLLEGVAVKLLRNNATVDSMTTDKSGGFNLAMQFDSRYIIEFSKSGYISKRIDVDLRNMPIEAKREGYDLGRFQMEMLPYVEGMQLEEYKIPVARYYYDEINQIIQLDRVYIKQRKERMESQKILNEKVAASQEAFDQKLQDEYNLLIRDADIEFESKDYELARSYYQDAIKLKPLAEYPRNQLKVIEALLADQLGEEEKYKALITQGDEAYALKDWETAKNAYRKAIRVKSTEAYPREQLKKIEEEIKKSEAVAEKPESEKKYTLKGIQIPSDKVAFSNELAQKYPQGLTVERSMEGSKTITRRIIVDGDVGVEFKRIEHNWGGVYYFKNGAPITYFIWQKEAIQQ
jgi:tetratricopeptide (TPR) repeat protein